MSASRQTSSCNPPFRLERGGGNGSVGVVVWVWVRTAAARRGLELPSGCHCGELCEVGLEQAREILKKFARCFNHSTILDMTDDLSRPLTEG